MGVVMGPPHCAGLRGRAHAKLSPNQYSKKPTQRPLKVFRPFTDLHVAHQPTEVYNSQQIRPLISETDSPMTMHVDIARAQMLRPAQVTALLGIGKTTLWRWVRWGLFPRPV